MAVCDIICLNQRAFRSRTYTEPEDEAALLSDRQWVRGISNTGFDNELFSIGATGFNNQCCKIECSRISVFEKINFCQRCAYKRPRKQKDQVKQWEVDENGISHSYCRSIILFRITRCLSQVLFPIFNSINFTSYTESWKQYVHVP